MRAGTALLETGKTSRAGSVYTADYSLRLSPPSVDCGGQRAEI